MTHTTPDLRARSPWAALTDIQEVSITPAAGPITVHLVVPGSKSFTNRALIISALAQGTSHLTGILRSDDSYWCIDSLRKLGTQIEVDHESVTVLGTGGAWPNQQGSLYIGAAGTTARFLPGALAAAHAGEWRVEASKRMSERPVKPMMEAFASMGGEVIYEQNPGCYPLTIRASGLRGGDVTISGSLSSQFISGLLIASPYAESPVRIHVTDGIVQHAYVQITIDMMRQFGAEVTATDGFDTITIQPRPYKGQAMALEADASTAGYFFAYAALTQSTVRVTNISSKTSQPDIGLIDVLERMGCRVERGEDYVEVQGTGTLRGGFHISMKEMSDQTLTLAALAVFADGPISISDVAHIRHHECDRIQAMCTSLAQLGIQVEEREDGMTIWPGHPAGTVLSSFDDHRMAMSLALIGTMVPGIRILDPGSVSKTCPVFFDMLQKLGVGVTLR